MKRICQKVLKNPKKSSIGNMSYRTAKNTKTNLVQQSQIYWSGKNKGPLKPRDVSALKIALDQNTRYNFTKGNQQGAWNLHGVASPRIHEVSIWLLLLKVAFFSPFSFKFFWNSSLLCCIAKIILFSWQTYSIWI